MSDVGVVPLAVDPNADPYLAPGPFADGGLPAAWLVPHPRRFLSPDELLDRVVTTSPWLAAQGIKGQSFFPTLHAVKRGRTLVDVEADWIMSSFPDWPKGRFVTLTSYQDLPRERLLERHQRWTASVEQWARQPTCQYRVIDEHLSGTSHLHLLLFGASQVGVDVLQETWRHLNRIPQGKGKHCAKVDPITAARVHYCAVRYAQRGEGDVLGPWPRRTASIAEPDESVLHREMKAQRRRPGRPVRELIDALWWLQCVLASGESYLVSDLRRAIVGQEFSYKTLLRAKRMLDVVCQKRGRRDWLWSSPSVNPACEDVRHAA